MEIGTALLIIAIIVAFRISPAFRWAVGLVVAVVLVVAIVVIEPTVKRAQAPRIPDPPAVDVTPLWDGMPPLDWRGADMPVPPPPGWRSTNEPASPLPPGAVPIAPSQMPYRFRLCKPDCPVL
jgi:hypothetical protein